MSNNPPGVAETPGPVRGGFACVAAGFGASVDLSTIEVVDLVELEGVGEGVSVKGVGLGGAGTTPNSVGGVFGRAIELAGAGIAGDADRAFFRAEGEGARSSSSSSFSSSSVPLMGLLASGELRAGRVDGLPTPRSPGVGVLVGGADVARSRGGAKTFVAGGGSVLSAGEPGGVVLRARSATVGDFPSSLEGVGVGGPKMDPPNMGAGVFGTCLTVGDSGGVLAAGGAAVSSSSSSSSSVPRSSSSDLRNASIPSSSSSLPSSSRNDLSPSSSSASPSSSSISLPEWRDQ